VSTAERKLLVSFRQLTSGQSLMRGSSTMIAMVRGHDRVRWVAAGPVVGMALGAVDSVVNHVPIWLGEVGTARAERGGWSQVAEFASLVFDAGWAWAATAVLVGWPNGSAGAADRLDIGGNSRCVDHPHEGSSRDSGAISQAVLRRD
jgi:hypothetical protein